MGSMIVRAGWLCGILLLLSACTSPNTTTGTKQTGLELSATVISPLEVALSWNAVTGAEGYRLERKTEAQDFAELASLTPSEQTNYTDTTISEDTTYTYRLTAKVSGAPAASDEASATVPKLGKPYALSALTWAYAKDAAGEPKKDLSSGGEPLKVTGKSYAQGLGTRIDKGANSEISYALTGDCTVFRAKVGVDDGSAGSAVFQLFADEVKLWESGYIKAGEAAKETGDIGVVNRSQLVLIVRPDASIPTPTEPLTRAVYANWLEPTLSCARESVPAAETFIKGQWGEVFDWQGLIATHLANLPDGRILSWSSWDKTKQGGTTNDVKENTTGYLWNPATNAFIEMNNPRHDMFCSGLAILPNGDVFSGGGGNGANLYKTSVFEVANNKYQWRAGPTTVRDHWYGTAVALPSGGVVMSMGSDKGYDSTEVLANATATTGTWDLLEGANTGPVLATMGTPTSDIPQPDTSSSSEYEAKGWYPYLSVAPDGKLFDAGPVPRLYKFDLTGEGKVTQVGSRNDQMRTWGTSIMYDEGKILVTGGAKIRGQGATNSAVAINLLGDVLEVKNAPSMAFARAFHSGVMLPTGEVLIVGGNSTGKQFTSDAAIKEAEVWNPATNTWRTLAAGARPRAYHSAAILLPDGRVLASGGGLCGRAGCAPGIDEPNGEIFSPPYLFNPDGTLAKRPVIIAAPQKIGHNETFTVTMEGRSVSKFSLIKLSAVSHGINTDLRYLKVAFVKGKGTTYSLTSDENPNVLTPGYYFLFALDDKGVPSVSKTILVAQTAP